jgi:hypothetical protein
MKLGALPEGSLREKKNDATKKLPGEGHKRGWLWLIKK